jgi:hypothetical protein
MLDEDHHYSIRISWLVLGAKCGDRHMDILYLCIYFVHDILYTYIVHPLSEDSSVIEEKYDVVVISGFYFGQWSCDSLLNLCAMR